jgi:ligand-binding sensor domain-containing protein/class 3 adenylate cyclase/predicted metal-dependent HD superfamily phosphohydrolase
MYRIGLNCFLFFTALIFINSLNAQTVYRFKNYTINDGLSQSSVTAIVQDINNSLWIGTQDGLNRFDGKTFETITSDDQIGLQNEYIKCAVKTKDGNLWFGTMNGLTQYNPLQEVFKTFDLKEKTAFQIESIAVDENQNLWVGTYGKGLYFFNRQTELLEDKSNLIKSKKITNLFCTSTGELIIQSEDLGLFVTNKEKNKKFSINLINDQQELISVNKIVQGVENIVYLATDEGLFQYNLINKTTQLKFGFIENEYGQLFVSDIYFSDNGTWFISTSNKGLFTVTPSGKVLNHTEDIFQKNALLFNDINLLFKDASGAFWAGTDRGLSCFDPFNEGIVGIGPSGDLEKGIPSPNVWCFAEDKGAENIFIGTDVGVSKFNRKTGRFEQYYRSQNSKTKEENKETTVLSLHVIDNKNILVGCVDGLFKLKIENNSNYNYKKITITPAAENEKFNRIYSIAHFKNNQYFLATKGGVVLIDLASEEIQIFENNPKQPKTTITAGVCRFIYKDYNGTFWFGTSSGELNTLSENNGVLKIIPFPYNSALLQQSKSAITSMCQTSSNDFWIGTFGNGLLHWNNETHKAQLFTKKNIGLPNNVVYGVLKAKDGNLWLSTNKGICCFNPKINKVNNYSEIDGLMSNEFNIGAYMQTSTGTLFFGGIYGYNYFDPVKLTADKKSVKVSIIKFKLDDKWLKPGDKDSPLTKPISQLSRIELSYKQRSFTIQFQPSDISNPELITYKYILEGSDEGETYIGNTTELRFSALSPGEYKLKLYARVGDGPWGEPTILEIYIKSPFWWKWWFWTIIVLVLGLSIYIFVRKRIEHERREQVRLEMKIAERTREVREQNIKIEKQKQQLELEKNKVLEQRALLQIEKDKTEKLLKNVIPEKTAEELKSKGKVSARAYKTVSVLFTDFVGFTKIAEHMNPSDLVSRLDVYFRKFDEIIVKNNLEKIKTIGDAYMCAGGVPVRNNTNPIDTVLAAVQIQDYMSRLKNDAIANHTDYWELRLGINTGEVTAGVIGSERLAFDVWGATVNHAQRMEMLGEPGKVTITGNTFKFIEPYFECVFRGKAQTKSRGVLDMYTVERIKPELSVNGEGIFPNERFHQIVNLHHYSSINYYKAERHIMKVLEKGLSNKLHYHSIEHTRDVVKAVERIALMEGVTDEGLFLLKSAATYHDAGFVEKYEKNEPVGARLAEEILPKYGYTEQHIQTIKELIFVTQIPHQPKNKLEEIMCDADLDYLGREDFHEIADRLRRELKEHGKIDSDKKWDEIQVQFLSAHVYFTETSKRTRMAKKLKNLEEVRKRLEKNEYLD